MSDSASDILADYMRLLRRPVAVPPVAASVLSTDLPVRDPSRSVALVFSPHPDDECLTGALPLRLRREQGWQIINVALTLGSNLDRRAGRKAELAKACAVLGYDCVIPVEDGFSSVHVTTRHEDVSVWQAMATRLAEIIAHTQPQAVFMPHVEDANATHIGCHYLGMDALALQPAGFSCAVFQTEYWRPLAEPNLMIGIRETDAATLLSALACYVGENVRNPFDTRFPSYLIDNVRRGSECVAGKGATAAAMDFAMLYQYGIWKNARFVPSALKRIIGTDQSVSALFD
jgi:LmbE family N-acetylglucosaminyl deacetylase